MFPPLAVVRTAAGSRGVPSDVRLVLALSTQVRAKRTASGVACCPPPVFGAPAREDSDGGSGSDHVGVASDSDDLDAPCFAAPGAEPGAIDGDHDEDKALRESRVHSFGPWSTSEIWSEGLCVGWGANCGCHFSPKRQGTNALRCKKSIGATATCTLDEAHGLAKQWLLAGLEIPAGRRDGRADHLGTHRHHLPLRTHEELDADAAALM